VGALAILEFALFVCGKRLTERGRDSHTQFVAAVQCEQAQTIRHCRSFIPELQPALGTTDKRGRRGFCERMGRKIHRAAVLRYIKADTAGKVQCDCCKG
jgi:hypothetical protein